MGRDNRLKDELRPVKFLLDYMIYPAGSVLVEFGNTKIICTASVETDVPPFLKQTGSGWVTAEYSMLPAATNTRTRRERQKLSGRTAEIQRLIGRSLRSVVDLKKIRERSIIIDCDVIQADGGTRTAAINGGYVALVLALRKLQKQGEISEIPIRDHVAAVSLGILNNELHLDLEYSEDSMAEVDMNLVMTSSRQIIEIQGTAEKKSFSPQQLSDMVEFGWRGIQAIVERQRNVLQR